MASSRSTRLISAFFILLLLAGVTLFFTVFKDKLQNRADSLRMAIEKVKSEYAFARITVLSQGQDQIRFRLTILNQEGEGQGAREYSLAGSDIFLESRVVHCRIEDQKKAFIFPWKVFTEKIAPEQGVDIRDIYLNEGKPLNYSTAQRSDTWDQTISDLYAVAFRDSDVFDTIKAQYIIDIYDSSLHLGIMGSFQPGRSYQCIIHPNGGLELKEE